MHFEFASGIQTGIPLNRGRLWGGGTEEEECVCRRSIVGLMAQSVVQSGDVVI